MPQRIRGVKGDKVGEGTRSVLADHEVAHTCRHRERNAHHHNQHGSGHRARSLLITHSLHRSSFLLRPPSQQPTSYWLIAVALPVTRVGVTSSGPGSTEHSTITLVDWPLWAMLTRGSPPATSAAMLRADDSSPVTTNSRAAAVAAPWQSMETMTTRPIASISPAMAITLGNTIANSAVADPVHRSGGSLASRHRHVMVFMAVTRLSEPV